MFSPQLKNNNNSLHRGIKGVTNKVNIELLNDLNMEKYIKLKLNGRKSIQCWPWFDFKNKGGQNQQNVTGHGEKTGVRCQQAKAKQQA